MEIARHYREHGRVVLDRVMRLGGPWIDAVDVSQQVFGVALAELDRFEQGRSFGAWMYRITRNVVSNARAEPRVRMLRELGTDRGQ